MVDRTSVVSLESLGTKVKKSTETRWGIEQKQKQKSKDCIKDSYRGSQDRPNWFCSDWRSSETRQGFDAQSQDLPNFFEVFLDGQVGLVPAVTLRQCQ